MSRRTERLGSTIRQELAVFIQRELADPRLQGLPSITRVKVAEDLSVADVFVTIMGTPGQQTAALNALRQSAGLMRTRLTKDLSLRQAPFLKFHIDEDLKKQLELMNLLEGISRGNAERGGQDPLAEPEDPPSDADESEANPGDVQREAHSGDADGGEADGGEAHGEDRDAPR